MTEFLRWVSVVLFSLIIFLTLPYGPSIRDYLFATYGEKTVVIFTGALLFCFLLYVFYQLAFIQKVKSFRNYLWTDAVALCYFYYLVTNPNVIEGVHFVEYGILGLLIYWAGSLRIRDKSIFLFSGMLTFAVGTLDETIQWWLPNRVGDLRDIGFNLLSGVLGQVVLWKGLELRRAPLFTSFSPKLLAGSALAASVSFLSFVPLVSDFGYRIVDAEIGTFKSRMTAQELLHRDKNESKTLARRIDKASEEEYTRFLEREKDPFVYEMRVRLFRRDRRLQEGDLFVAAKENQILEKYFGNTLRESKSAWPPEFRSRGEQVTGSYVSPVGEEIITLLSPRQYLVVSTCTLLATVSACGLLFRIRRRQARVNHQRSDLA